MEETALCFIPARGGSKRVPKKNKRLLNGKPLVSYTISAVLKSKCFTDVYVSSDDPEILEIAENYSAQIDHRPVELSGDLITAVQVLYEFVQRSANQDRWKFFAMCLPTCPFRTADDVKKAMEMFWQEKESCPRLIGVTRCDFPPQFALKQIPDTNMVDLREPESYAFSTRSQDFGGMYYPNGSIYITTAEVFLTSKSFIDSPMLRYIMPPERSFDIDHPYQFQIAEYMMSQQKSTTTRRAGGLNFRP
jgi:N-acylneuraminate cytidylyltransferase